MNRETTRSKSGSFYTPRYIVDYVVRESLLFVLLSRVFSGDGKHEQDIRHLLDPECDFRDGMFSISERSRIIKTIENLSVIDPAVGSGAFLLSMLNSLVLVLKRLRSGRTDFDRKLHVVKDCLYGVDIQPVSCLFTRMCLFLSLVDEYDADVDRLSDLSANVVSADSLVDLFGQGKHEQMSIMYSDHALGTRKFDIVIGNPPYRQLKKDRGKLRRRYYNVGFKTFAGKGDLYQLFIEKGLSLLRSGDSFLGFVTSNTWLKSEYGLLTRRLLLEHMVFRLINLGPRMFPGAIVDTCVLIARRGRGSGDFKVADTNLLPPTKWDCLHRLKNDGPWCIVSAGERDLLEKMESSSHRMIGEHKGVSMCFGMITRKNDAFVVSESVKEQIVRDDPSADDIMLPVLMGKNIRPYRAKWDGSWLINTHPGIDVNDYPSIKKHLSNKKMRHGEYNHIRHHYWFHSPKLVWQELCHHGRCFFDEHGKYSTVSSTYVMTCDNEEGLAVVLCLVEFFCSILVAENYWGNYGSGNA